MALFANCQQIMTTPEYLRTGYGYDEGTFVAFRVIGMEMVGLGDFFSGVSGQQLIRCYAIQVMLTYLTLRLKQQSSSYCYY